MSNLNIAMSQAAAAGVPTGPEGAWDLSYAYFDDPFAWDVSSAVSKTSVSISTTDSNPQDLFFSSDGTQMYVISKDLDRIRTFTLTTPWLVSTASYTNYFSVGTLENNPTGMYISPDGTKMFVVGTTNDNVSEFTLSTPWLITSASFVQSSSVIANPAAVFFSPDGTKMYTCGASNVLEYTLTTPWDVSTLSYIQFFSVSAYESTTNSVSFSTDGTKMHIIGPGSDIISEFDLSTPWDISTAVYSKGLNIGASENTPYGLFFQPDGAALFFVGASTKTVYQYNLGGFSVYGQERAATDLFFRPDGTEMYVIGTTGDDVNQYSLSTAWDTSTATYVRLFDTGTVTLAPQGLYFKPDGTTLYTIGTSTDAVAQWSLSVPWDISSTSYVQQFSVSAQDTNPVSVTFKPDGTKMYVVGNAGIDVNEYDLSTAWDVSTASYLQNLIVSAQVSGPQGFYFKPDGKKMYLIGVSSDAVSEYDLSTAWDISTASYLQNFYVGATEGIPTGLFFRDDGAQMFVVGTNADRVFTYSLGVQE